MWWHLPVWAEEVLESGVTIMSPCACSHLKHCYKVERAGPQEKARTPRSRAGPSGKAKAEGKARRATEGWLCESPAHHVTRKSLVRRTREAWAHGPVTPNVRAFGTNTPKASRMSKARGIHWRMQRVRLNRGGCRAVRPHPRGTWSILKGTQGANTKIFYY